MSARNLAHERIDEHFRLSKRELGGYAFGDLAGQTLINFVSTFFLLFCTNFLGIHPAVAGTIFLVARFWDAFNDPIMGLIADRTRTRWGSYRPFLVIGAPLVFITFLMMFTKPGFGATGLLIWAYAAYLLYGTCATITGVPYGVLPNVITLNPRDRQILGVTRDYGANIGGFLVSTFGTALIVFFSGVGDGQTMTTHGFRVVSILAALFAVVCYLVVFFTTKERVVPPKSPVKFFTGLKITFKNRPALCLLLMGFCFNMAIQFKANMTSYYCIYIMGNTQHIGTLLSVVYTLPLIGLLFVPKLMTLFARRTFLSAAGLFTVLSGVISLAGGASLPGQVLSSVLLGLALSCTFALIWSSLPDAIDDGEIRTGARAPGVTYALATFMIKAAAGLSSFVAGWVLTWISFDAGLAAQSAATLQGMSVWYGVYPIIWGALMFLISRIYNLTDDKVRENASVLAKRRAGEMQSGT